MKLLLLFLLMFSCGRAEDFSDPVEWDPELAMFVHAFETDMHICGVTYANSNLRTVEYVSSFDPLLDMPPETIGVTRVFTGDVYYPPKIKVQYDESSIQILDIVKDFTYWEKSVLMYHELGHAVLYVDHIEASDEIMSESMDVTGEYWTEARFNKAKKRFFGKWCAE